MLRQTTTSKGNDMKEESKTTVISLLLVACMLASAAIMINDNSRRVQNVRTCLTAYGLENAALSKPGLADLIDSTPVTVRAMDGLDCRSILLKESKR